MKLFQSLVTLTAAAVPVASFSPSSSRSLSSLSRSVPSVLNNSRSTTRLFSSAADFAQGEIDNNKVVVFSKSYCPFCMKTKDLLWDKDVEFTLHELDERDDGADIQAALLDMSGQKTVPNVFINGKHVGGNDAMQAAKKSGELDKMLAE